MSGATRRRARGTRIRNGAAANLLASALDARAPERLRPRLLRWYRRHRRTLPWRATRDPYAIWISEAMLQQTRVETVLRYWSPFLRRFPTVGHLARAREDSVLAKWSGLGYYSRARSLHRAAKAVVARHGGMLPADVDALRALPGIGRYTAGAVASIAFGIPAAVVDGNVARVLSRLFAIPGDPRRPVVAARLWTTADRLVSPRSPGDWNQALMELGATVCTARSPRCGVCPLRAGCAALRRNAVEAFPARGARAPVREERRQLVFAEHDGHVLLVRRNDRALLRGLWELPDAAEAARVGLRPKGPPALTIRHAILDRRIESEVLAAPVHRRVPPLRDWRWVALRRASSLPLSATAMKALRTLALRTQTGGGPKTAPRRHRRARAAAASS